MTEIHGHPILPQLSDRPKLTFFFGGTALEAREGQSVAGALMANGIYRLGISHKLREPRGLYCGSGRCCSCLVEVEGFGNTRACVTPVQEGMKVNLYNGQLLGKENLE